jgi:flagellar biosynthetic protein FliR
MNVSIEGATLTALLLAMVRAAAWLVVVPAFNNSAIPNQVRALLAVALALPVVPTLQHQVTSLDNTAFITALAIQVAAGVTMGFITSLLFTAVQAAGDLIDLFGGFTLAMAYDPMSKNQTSVFGRIHGLLAITLLFATDAHLVVIQGFLQSYRTLPLDGTFSLDKVGSALTSGMSEFFLSALQVAGPLIAVLVLADAGLGLLTRVSPSLNAFSLGFPIKILLTVLCVGVTFPMLPGIVGGVSDRGTELVMGIFGG